MDSGRAVRELRTGLKAHTVGIQYTSDGKSLWVGDDSGTVERWDSAGARRLGKPARVDNEASLLKFPVDGQKLLWADPDDVAVWDLPAGKRLFKPSTGAFSFDGRALLREVGGKGEFELSDLASGRQTRLRLDRVSKVAGMALSGDDNTLATFELWDKEIVLRDLRNGTSVVLASGALPGAEERSQLVFSPDGRPWRPVEWPALMLAISFRMPSLSGTWKAAGVWASLWKQRPASFATWSGVAMAAGLLRRASLRRKERWVRGGIALWEASLESWQQLACRSANRNLTREEWKASVPGTEYRLICDSLPAIDYSPRPKPE